MDEDLEQRRAEGLQLQALLPEGSNTQPRRDGDSVDAALELWEWGGLVGLAIGVGALVIRSLSRRRAA